jgi:apolipoprotein N-acyltransferase
MDVRLDFAPNVGATFMVARGIFGRGPRHQAGFRQVQQAPPLHRLLDKTWLIHTKPPLVTWAESFIFAGTSALLLLIANLFPDYWYFSFFALTPFLYRIIKATPKESLRLGFLFGLSFFSVSLIDLRIGSPVPSVLILLFGTILFALFGWTVGWARKRWGFNPSIVALLWVGLEIGLMKLGFARSLGLGMGGLFGKAELSHPSLQALAGLFGFLTVSAIIVLLNSLLVLAIIKTLKLKRPRGNSIEGEEKIWDILSTPWFFAQKVYLVPEGRAPPYMVARSLSQN